MKMNVSSIRQRLQRLEKYIGELEKQQPVTLETFSNDFTRQLAVERAFQVAPISRLILLLFINWVTRKKAAMSFSFSLKRATWRRISAGR